MRAHHVIDTLEAEACAITGIIYPAQLTTGFVVYLTNKVNAESGRTSIRVATMSVFKTVDAEISVAIAIKTLCTISAR